jgi:hypothetical protein
MVPAAMVFAALGLMLAFVPRRMAAGCLALVIVLASVASLSRIGASANDGAIMLCWGAVAVLAARTYWPKPSARRTNLAIAAIAGVISGIAIAASATPSSLWQPLLASLVIIPATVAVERGYAVAPRVVASWLVAVALLAALLPYVVAHPGYIADHRG